MIPQYWVTTQSNTQDSSWQVAHQSPPVTVVEKLVTSLLHHSHPHANTLGTTRSPERRWSAPLRLNMSGSEKGGPGTAFQTGRRVRNGHFKGPGPNRTYNKWDWIELNFLQWTCEHVRFSVSKAQVTGRVHCGSAVWFVLGFYRPPYYCAPFVCVPDVLGGLAVCEPTKTKTTWVQASFLGPTWLIGCLPPA